MKIKKFIFGVATAAVVAGTPVTMTSCDDDDINTVLNLIDLFFQSADDLANTAWLTADSSEGFEFGTGGQGIYYSGYELDESGNVIPQQFTYTLDTTNNTLTIKLSSGSRIYTVTEFVKNSKLTLTYNGKTIYLKYLTE